MEHLMLLHTHRPEQATVPPLVRTTVGTLLMLPAPPARPAAAGEAAIASGTWRDGLPMLHSAKVTLRELRLSDAPSLLRLLSAPEVAKFIAPPPTTVEQFERFITWTHNRRREGHHVCFGAVPEGMEHAVGIFQVRAIGDSFEIADWGFALGSPFWGTGVFIEGAQLTLRFAFDDLRVWRVEARSLAANGRGNSALRKAGAVLEARLPRSFAKDGQLHDQTTWSILEPEWRQANGGRRRPSLFEGPVGRL